MIILTILLLFTPITTDAQTLPEWYLPLREAIYEMKLSSGEILPLYREISEKAKSTLSGHDQLVVLSRCEYMMGRVYIVEENKTEANKHLEEGMRLAQAALDIRKSSEAWTMLAENLSYNCLTRSNSYVMSNGLDVVRHSEKALALNKRNAAAQYLIASRWVYAPPPFHNYRRGLEMLNSILTDFDMEKDDKFNTYYSLAYTHNKQKNYGQARSFIQRALEIYPTNKNALDLLAEL